jgi:hypothetical protein
MLITLLGVVAVSLIVLAIVFHSARNVADRRKGKKRANLIRLRLQDQASEPRRAIREVPIRLAQH